MIEPLNPLTKVRQMTALEVALADDTLAARVEHECWKKDTNGNAEEAIAAYRIALRTEAAVIACEEHRNTHPRIATDGECCGNACRPLSE